MANEIRKAERCKGIVLDDDGVILAMEAVPDGARERFIPVAIDGGKINRSRSSLVSMQQFGILKGHISRLLRSTRDALLAGDITCDPYAGACDFCDYHRICRFDPSNGKDGYREIASVRKNDFFEQHADEETEV